jgi:hypothetical protein
MCFFGSSNTTCKHLDEPCVCVCVCARARACVCKSYESETCPGTPESYISWKLAALLKTLNDEICFHTTKKFVPSVIGHSYQNSWS